MKRRLLIAKRVPELAILALWLVAILATLVVTRDTGEFTRLAPVYLVCLIGSMVTVRHARAR